MRRSLDIPVHLTFRGPPGARVELLGDFPDFKYPLPMRETSPGQFECSLDLEPGIYRYKFRVDGRFWVLDPRARAIDHGEPYRNGLIIVDGAAPPLIFAPDRKHVVHREDGRLLVQVEAADPQRAPTELWVHTSQGAPRLRAPLTLARARGDWQLLRAELQLPEGAKGGSFGFAGAPERVFPLPERRPPESQPPGWIEGAVFYTIFIDRWLRGSKSPADPLARSRRTRSTANTCYGGDLDGVTESLPYLQDLGVDAVVLTPVHPSPTPHRYDSTDLLAVDPALGGETAMERLVNAAHRRKMKIVADVAVTHVNERHPAFQDVLDRGERSRFASFFRVRKFPVRPRDGSTYAWYYDRPELPLLDLSGPARRYALKAALRLVEHGVDGLRLDAMNDAPADFWRELRARARAKNPDLLLLGEVVGDNLARYAEERGVDAATDFKHREALLSFFGRGAMSAEQFWEQTGFDELRSGLFDPSFRLRFLDNHDTVRFLSIAVLYDRLRLALAWLWLRPEPVAMTYGTELGMAGGDASRVLDDAWPERLPMPPLGAAPNQTQQLLRHLSALRRVLRETAEPHVRLVRAQGSLLVVERRASRGVLQASFNAGNSAVSLPDLPSDAELAVAVNGTGAELHGLLPPLAARVVWSRSGALIDPP